MARRVINTSGKRVSKGSFGGRGNYTVPKMPTGYWEIESFNIVDPAKATRWTPENSESGEYDYIVVKAPYDFPELKVKAGDTRKVIMPLDNRSLKISGDQKESLGVYEYSKALGPNSPALKPGDLIRLENVSQYVSNKVYSVSKGVQAPEDTLVVNFAGVFARGANLTKGTNGVFHGYMSASSIAEYNGRYRQTIRAYHTDQAKVLPADKFVQFDENDENADYKEVDAKNIDILAEAIRKNVKNIDYKLGTPGVLLRSIGNISKEITGEDGQPVKNPENLLFVNEDFHPVSFNVIGYIPPKEVDGQLQYSELHETSANSIADSLKRTYNEGVAASEIDEDKRTKEQERAYGIYEGLTEVLSRVSSGDNYVTEIIPTSTMSPSQNSFLSKKGPSRSQKIAQQLEGYFRFFADIEGTDKVGWDYSRSLGLAEGIISTLVIADHYYEDGTVVPKEYTVTKSGTVLDEDKELVEGKKATLGPVKGQIPTSFSPRITFRPNQVNIPADFLPTKALEEVSPLYKDIATKANEITVESLKKVREREQEAENAKKPDEASHETKDAEADEAENTSSSSSFEPS